MRAATFVQDFFTVAKVGALIMIIVTGAVLLCTGVMMKISMVK